MDSTKNTFLNCQLCNADNTNITLHNISRFEFKYNVYIIKCNNCGEIKPFAASDYLHQDELFDIAYKCWNTKKD